MPGKDFPQPVQSQHFMKFLSDSVENLSNENGADENWIFYVQDMELSSVSDVECSEGSCTIGPMLTPCPTAS